MADDRVPATPERPGEGRREILREWPSWLILAALWVGSLLVAPRLPARVPLHWDLHGEVNGWGSPWEAALLLPALATGSYLFILVLDWGRLDFRAAHALGLVLILIPLGAGMIYAYVLRHRMETAGTLPPEAP